MFTSGRKPDHYVSLTVCGIAPPPPGEKYATPKGAYGRTGSPRYGVNHQLSVSNGSLYWADLQEFAEKNGLDRLGRARGAYSEGPTLTEAFCSP